jgi:integrase
LLARALARRNFIIRKILSDKGVVALKPRAARYAHSDPEQRGGVIRVQPSGAKSYWAVARNPHGKQVWTLIGVFDGLLKIEKARDAADMVVKRIRAGLPAFESPPTTPESFKAVTEAWLKRHVQAKALLSETEVRQRLEKHIYPRWQDAPFIGIRRADVADLLDAIEDGFGPRAADHVLEIVRRIMNWYATRHDDYVSPLVRGMRRWNPTEHARARILNDDEIRAVWKAAADNGTFGALVRLALLTASRRDKLASMKWVDISEDGLWSIPTASNREKGTAGELKLPQMALDIIAGQPKIGDNPYVFAGRGNAHISGYSKCKSALDAKLSENHPNMVPWTIHDLRRTARSLMSRAGVRPDIAERVLGHRIPGVKGIYDRHQYFDEKGDALAELATLIYGIVQPKDNVVSMTTGGGGKKR